MNFRKAVKSLIPKNIFKRIEPLGHLLESVIFQIINGFPTRGITVIGVTGTNGKTTVSYMIHQMLKESEKKVGLMTTVAYGVGYQLNSQISHMTTVSSGLLLKRIKQMRKEGIDYLVLETTSHALAQNRVWGIKYSLAVFTNLTHEHLDYHGTFERYRQAKVKLFKITNKTKKGLRIGIVNADDPSSQYFAQAITNPLTYGINSGELRAKNIKLSPQGISYDAKFEKNTYKIKSQIPGSFNVYNSLAVVGVGTALGLSQDQIEQGIASLNGVEGRMTRINEGQKFEVIVDFAHTPDSFEKLFKDLRPVIKGKLIVMFGSAGRRDEAKRPIQGQLAGEYADEVILTEEDDRDIDGKKILEEIAKGAKEAGKTEDKDLFLVHDRTKAIEFALKRAKPGDTVLLLGKGHEKTIERIDGEHPWDEIGLTKKILATFK